MLTSSAISAHTPRSNPEAAGKGMVHPFDILAAQASVIEAERDDEIIAQGEAAQYCYQVLSGCVRTVKLLEDGRRQVGEFFLAGDVFGWETIGAHEFAAEAVTPVTLRRFRRAAVEERADSDCAFARQLRLYQGAQVRSARLHMVLLGRKTAAERIASFLLDMRDRLVPRAGTPDIIELPMSRADMADYLGLTIETVCRGLTDLRRHGTIAVERARIAIQNRSALDRAGSDWVH